MINYPLEHALPHIEEGKKKEKDAIENEDVWAFRGAISKYSTALLYLEICGLLSKELIH